VDPREMIHQIRRDFESRPRVAVVIAVLIALGIAAWIPAIGARGSGSKIALRGSAVLSDPFDSQTK
jgi:hypothetical protein